MTPREQARLRGDPRYPGKPCKRGHSGERYTASYACVECAVEWKRRARALNPDYYREHDRRWKRKNVERVRKQSEEWRKANLGRRARTAREWRKQNPERYRQINREGQRRWREKQQREQNISTEVN